MQRLLILLSCIIIESVAVGQTVVESHVQQYTTDNGLPSNGIKGLQWDEETGFLWMATEAGIVRFNGVDFKSYTKQNMPSIASERMLFIARNYAGRIYTADQPGNIFLIDKSKPVLWRPTKVKGSFNDFLKNYYLLAVSDTFFLKQVNSIPTAWFSNGSEKIIPLNDTACFMHKTGDLYYQAISFTTARRLPFEKGSVTNFFKIGKSYFITNTKKEAFILNPVTFAVTPVSLAAASVDILETKNNSNLIYWQNGMNSTVFIDEEKVWLLSYDGKAINTTLIFAGIPADSYIKSVQYSEKKGLLFIGTESKGLVVISQNRVQSKKRNDPGSKNRNSYYSQIELDNGNILTNESDIIGDNPMDKISLPVEGKFSFNISHTGDSLLWYSQVNKKTRITCLNQYNKKTGITTAFPKIKNGEIIAVTGSSVYLASTDGISILKSDSAFTLYQYPKSLKGTTTFDFTEISPGILAIATCAGLFSFNTANNRFDTLFTKENICVRNIWKYKEYVFFGTYGSGFYIYKDGKIKQMPLDKNKYLLYTHCFAPDDNGFCWISTNRGLFKASLSEITNAFEKDMAVVYYHYFGKKDGMEMTELNGGCTPCALRLKNNIISFPTMDGLLWVEPGKAIPVLPDGEIFIDEMLVDNIAVDTDSLQYKSLPAQTAEIIFSLGFSAWCNKENIYLDYQLNDTTNWKAVNTENETFIRLGNLEPGKYILRVRKLNGFGKNNYSYKTIKFSIATPWYKQWWFNVLIAAAILGIFFLFYVVRVKQLKRNQLKLEKQVAEKTEELLQKNDRLEKNNNLNNRLISIISHDIITPLKFLNVAGKNLLEKKSVMPEELKDETIREITTTSKELQLLSTNILNWIKYQNENRRLAKEKFYLQEILNQVFSILNSMAHQKNLSLISNVDKDLQVTQYFEALKILIYNLVTNAIHFSDNGSIVINALETGNKLIISVSDEGVGMTAEQIKNIMADQFIVSSANMDNKKGNGLGYLIIKDLLKMLNAQLSINSEKGKGTTVYVELPK